MIPLTLQIQNFLSYGSPIQTIHFHNYKLICLSGKNGHGKSALLDAITWAIWGQARKISSKSKPDDGVLKIGSVEMIVCLDFIMKNQTYRIKRSYSKKYGKPSLHIDFGIINKETEQFVPLTEKTVRNTQQKIEQIIGLTYESFVNSSFLRQGQSNEFSKKSPKERKEILINILGLNQYDKARKHALEYSKQLSLEKEKLIAINDHLQVQTQQLPIIQNENNILLQQLTEIKYSEQIFNQQLTKLNSKIDDLLLQERSFEKIINTYLHYENEKNSFIEDLNKIIFDWKKTHKIIISLHKNTMTENKKTYYKEQLKEQETLHQNFIKNNTEYILLKEQETLLLKKIYEEEKKQEQGYQLEEKKIIMILTTQEHVKKQHELQLQTLAQTIQSIENKYIELQTIIDPHALLTGIIEHTASFERLKQLYYAWIEQGNRYNNELKKIKEKKDIDINNNNPSCPLCEQNLSQARKRFLNKKANKNESWINHRIKRLSTIIIKLKETLINHYSEIEQLQQLQQYNLEKNNTLQEQITIQKNYTVILQEYNYTLTLYDNLKNTYYNIHKNQNTIQKHNELLEKIIHDINKNKEIQKHIKYDQQIHLNIKKQIEFIEQQEEIAYKLQEYNAVQIVRKKNIEELYDKIRTIEKKIIEYSTKKQPYEQCLKEKIICTQEHNNLINKYQECTTKKNEAMQKNILYEANITSLTNDINYITENEIKIITLNQNIEDATIISTAFGKDGLQALLLEDTLPEIELEANNILQRLTENQTTIHIESLKDLKKGGTKETLDINISDTYGIRPYELFSGGEAFRIDFALRIALSKLLARRAGSALQTLIIDEGFGSQDEEGLSRIMDAIYTIQDDFEKIIIVSHLTTMKSQFPVHFNIEKNAYGSNITIFEQG